MCFSATASFAAAGVTSVAGGAALRWARQPAHRVLAAIPIFFAAHQFAEGALWLALTLPGLTAWQQPAMFTFLAFGEAVWPFWVPLSILALERDPLRRKMLSALLVLGTVVSLARAYGLATDPVTARVAGQHIRYEIDSPFLFRRASDVAYAIVTVLPPFVSSIRLMRFIGLILLASLGLSKIFFYDTFISVWCFFAALISALLVVVVRRESRRSEPSGSSP